MRIKDLLEMIEKSILRENISTQDLYKNYYHLILEVLRPFKDKTKINGLTSLKGLSNKNAFDTFIRSSSHEVIENKIIDIIKELRAWVRTHQNLARIVKIPSGAEQKQMRLDITSRLKGLIINWNADFAGAEQNLQKLQTACDIVLGICLPKNDINFMNVYETIISLIDKIDNELNGSHGLELQVSALADKILQNVQQLGKMQY